MMIAASTCMLQPRRMAMMTAVFALISLLLVPLAAGVDVELPSFAPFLLLAGMFAALLPYFNWRKMYRLRAAMETGILSFLFTVPVLVLTYCAMRLGFPLADDWLAAMDAQLGIHTPDIVQWVDRFPALAWILDQAYMSLGLQLLLLPPLLALFGRADQAYRFTSCYFVLCAISSLIAIGFPSLGAFGYYGLTQADLSNIDARFGYEFSDSFNAVRNDPTFRLSLGVASGIVTFPSVHAGAAVLCAWAALASSLLRWPMLALNVAMFASAITHGAHYFVDLLAGALVALATIMLVNRLTIPGTLRAQSVLINDRGAPATAA
ncbi:phosphatase PAP2 family protein [Sphingomonas colocasiae]|uniref:Phosphatase PAP2 family protein n=1 Tax=Sphingomonas colocasiae TaxID=1848973 RepID=A0ABS7PUE8_9SPHN|nr:phosphatase PAP2 family protein [Sphingomonas colocasiae]MBY8824823.1 phosphatase PAP2 family protein [Sphingomonas colocasiae]